MCVGLEGATTISLYRHLNSNETDQVAKRNADAIESQYSIERTMWYFSLLSLHNKFITAKKKSQMYFVILVQQKFDFHPAMCYNFKAKSECQCLMKFDLRAQEPDEIIGGLSDIKRQQKT